MRLRGLTSTDDWNPVTLLSMMCRRECWHFYFNRRDWRWSAMYTWYDGPIWQVWVGPFVLCIGYV